MSDDKIVSIDGSPVVSPDQPDQNCIESIELLLDLAERGEVAGVCFVVKHPDGATSSAHAGNVSIGMAGELLYAANLIMKLIRG